MTTFLTSLLLLRKRIAHRREQAGSMAVQLHMGGVSLVAASRPAGARPRIDIAKLYPCDESTRAVTLEQLSKENPAAGRQCATLLSPTQYQILTLEAPRVPESEQKTAVRWLLKDLIDFPSSEASIDVLSIPSKPDATGRATALFAVVARTSVVRKHQASFPKQIPLTVIDIPELAQRNIASFAEDLDRGLALVSFDEDGGLLTITCHGELYTARRIGVSTEQITQQNLAQRQVSLERVALEIQRSLDHFDRQFNHITISKLLLAPMTDSSSLLSQLETSLYLPVEVLDLASIIDVSLVPGLENPTRQQQYFLSIGAALRNMERSQ